MSDDTSASVAPPRPERQVVSLLGHQNLPLFQQCAEAATYLNKERSEEWSITVTREFGYAFEARRSAIAAKIGGDIGAAVGDLRVLVYNEATGKVLSGDEFIAKATRDTNFKLFDLPDSDPNSYTSLARQSLLSFLESTGSEFVWLSLRRDEQLLGRVVIQLFSKVCPKTCTNFVRLCRGDLPDVVAPSGEKVKLSYKGTSVYRVVHDAWLQAGDIAGKKDGTSGYSIYGPRFPDESFAIPFDEKGIVGMVSQGEHTNASAFFITMGRSSWMNGRYVGFGRVVEGLQVIDAINGLPTRHNQTPTSRITIEDCGHVDANGY